MAWNQLTNIKGDRGDRGAKGDKGDQGLPGTNGVPTDEAVATNLGNRETLTGAATRSLLPLYAGELPAYAGASRPHSYDRALALYNGESAAMTTARARIAGGRRGDRRTRITAFGDSRTKTEGIPNVSGKKAFNTLSYPAQLRELLSARMGETYFDPRDDLITAISGFAFNDASLTTNHVATTLGQASSTTFVVPQACPGFDLWGFRTGTAEVATITVDGVVVGTWAPGSGASWKRYECRGLANTNHTVTVSIPALSAGSFSLSRFAPYFGDTGLTVTSAGRSSSNATHWDDATWSSLLPTLLDANGYRPDVGIMQIGTNWGTSTYATLKSVAQKVTAAGTALILVSFGPRAEDATDPNFNVRRGYQYDLADELNVPLIDNLQVVGPWDVANGRALFADTVHENPAGASLEAFALRRALGL